MRFVGTIAGVLVAVLGLIWTLQGLNSTFVPQSFMTGSRFWVVAGLVAVSLGVAIAAWSWKRYSR